MKSFITIFLIIVLGITASSQTLYLPLNQEYNSKLQKQLYSKDVYFHTSIRPYYIPDIEASGINYDSIKQLLRIERKFLQKWKQNTWDKLLNDDVATFIKKDYEIIANPLMNFVIGRDMSNDKSTWVNTRGFELKGRIGKNLGYYTNFYENQAVFPEYLDDYIRNNNVIPGQGMVHTRLDNGGFDYAASTAYLSLKASQYFNFQLGHGKNFLGDGYRSLLLSDNSFNNLFLKTTVNFWHLKYQVLYNQYIDIRSNQSEIGFPRKYSTVHYLSYAISKRVNLSFFDAIIWQATDSAGNYRGFDLQYLNPIIFMRPVEFSVGSPDNALMGLNLSVIVSNHNVFYGQLLLDEFKLKEVTGGNGWWGNKQAFQLGFKSFDIFKITNLFFQTEYNFVRPYTYTHRVVIQNYGHYNQPLAHPYGANFWESVSFLKYHVGRFYFQYKFLYSIIGEDKDGKNYGKNIYKSYNTAANEYNNFVGQGLKTTLVYNDFRASYLINPSYNLNFTIGLTDRTLSNSAENSHSTFIYFALRTSIDNYYYDF